MATIPLILLFAGFAWLILVMAMWKGDTMLGFIAGAFILMIGIFGLIYGIDTANNNLTRAFGFVHIGIGMLTTIISGWEGATT